MKITVLTGSPHQAGATALLADKFIQGAEEAGHQVYRFDAAEKGVSPCIACDCCGQGCEPCVMDDDMEELNPHLLEADLVAFVTPLYYSGMSAQLKTVVDRFYGIDNRLCGSGKKTVLLAACADGAENGWAMDELAAHYKGFTGYLQWENLGMVLATGCGSRGDAEASPFPEQAYQLGKSL